MAYQQFPYLQAHPPPGYGAPGSTAYFTTQHLGGFYAPISNNPPFPQAHGAAPMIGGAGLPPGMPGGGPTGPIGSIGSGGQMFNSWPGVPEEQEKQREEEQAKAQAQAQAKSERSKEKKSKRKKNKMYRSSTPWEQIVTDIEKEEEEEEEEHRGGGSGGSQDDGGSYDHCDCSGSEGSTCSGSEGDEGSTEEEEKEDNGDTEVVIQPGGSAQVVVYLNHKNQAARPPKRTTFVVSARRMRAEARGWLHMCHRGTDRYDTTVGDEAAVVGMYWLLQVLHTGPDGDTESEYDYDHSHGHSLRPGMAPATTPRAPMTIPTELPARVFAYTTLFAHQFGVLDKGPHSLPGNDNGRGNGNGNGNDEMMRPGVFSVNTPVDRFRARAEVWLRAITNHPRHHGTLDSAAIVPADWPFVLYTARVLSDRALFATCLRTLLDRWYVDERGVFCDASGPARLDLLPASMRETVLRDMASLKMARERSADAIITGAMNVFGYGATGR
ncbi:hypothetical protein SCUCBS95973_001466 [Sporothrix curviconia]|uniref:Uncharacterized protein n=1 Tax=Sporothrix curviconia TaxID=1260050 RepID=A0ABP0AYU8_9PEZI